MDRIRRTNPTAARRYAAGIRAIMESLLDAPDLGSWVDDLDTEQRYRQRVYRNHRIIYRRDDPFVVVVRIFDGRRDPMDLREPEAEDR